MKVENQIIKIRKFFKWSILFFWLFTIFSLLMCWLMELSILKDDIWLFHRYITNFAGRVTLLFIVQTIIVSYLYVAKKVEKLPFSFYSFVFLFFLDTFIDNAGNLFGWYSVGKDYSIIWYDDFVHFTCAILITMAFFSIYYNLSIDWKLSSKNNILIISLLAFLTSFALGTLFGVYEYYSDIFLKTYMVGGVEDAITDNVYDFSGAIVGFCILNTKWIRGLYEKYRRM